MADRFPSLEDFSQDQTELVEGSGAVDTDDFLARERALLGEDADQFVTPQDQVVAAGDVSAENDLLGVEDDPIRQAASEEVTGFESSFPAVDMNEAQNEKVAPGGTITGSEAAFTPAGFSSYQETEEEPEPVREWRGKRDADVARRGQISNEKKENTIKKAREDIDDFYVSYNNKSDKFRAQTRAEAEQFLANREDTSSGGTSWERIAKLVDVSGKGSRGGASGSGKERFRELLLDLKKDQGAPGASGI